MKTTKEVAAEIAALLEANEMKIVVDELQYDKHGPVTGHMVGIRRKVIRDLGDIAPAYVPGS
jgi:hypothetical protein